MSGAFSGVSSNVVPPYGPGGGPEFAAPTARRHRVPRWLNLKFITGMILIILAIVAGTFVTLQADNTTSVWSLRSALPRGAQLSQADLVSVKVRLPDNKKTYISTDEKIAGQTLIRDLGAKELVPMDALRDRPCGSLVSIPVTPRHLPASLKAGARIDVYTTLEGPTKLQNFTERLIAGVPVQQVTKPAGGTLATSGEWSVAIRVPTAQVQALTYGIRSRLIDIAVVPGVSGATTDPCSEPSQQTAQPGQA